VSKETNRVRANHAITAPELRVVGVDGANLGVLSRAEALKAANDAGLDLIEISPNAAPPIAKIMEYGKYLYEQKKEAARNKGKIAFNRDQKSPDAHWNKRGQPYD
jgi:translation initiation factor IF-3